MMIGMVELAFFTGRYLDALDLTREAARYASLRDPFDPGAAGDFNCSTLTSINFWYDTSCIFSPPQGAACADAAFCNGFNPYLDIDLSTDDVVITAFTVSDHEAQQAHPLPAGYWALSDHDVNPATANWTKDCQGNVERTTPFFTLARMNSILQTDENTPPSKGYITVEFYYCYHQVLDLPILSDLIPNPMRTHVYTVMPLPAAAPTATTTSVSP
jgi:hypothetical protein